MYTYVTFINYLVQIFEFFFCLYCIVAVVVINVGECYLNVGVWWLCLFYNFINIHCDWTLDVMTWWINVAPWRQGCFVVCIVVDAPLFEFVSLYYMCILLSNFNGMLHKRQCIWWWKEINTKFENKRFVVSSSYYWCKRKKLII